MRHLPARSEPLRTRADGVLADRSRAGLARRGVETARSRGPVREALAALAARLVEARGWERLGFARLGDYGRERLGLSARSLHDLAHVHARLEALPRLRAALRSGELSWTRARLLARVATPESEEAWLARARGMTATALERLVRAVDSGALESGGGAAAVDEDGFDAAPKETFSLRCAPEVQVLWYRARHLAPRVAGERLTPAAVLELVTAEVLSEFPLSDDAGTGPPQPPHALEDEAGIGASAPASCARGAPVDARAVPESSPPLPAPPAFLARLLAGLEAADAFEIDRRLRRVVALEQRLDARLGAVLARVAGTRAYRALGCPTMEHYAREQLGISPRKVRALLRLERVGQGCPSLATARRRGMLSWVQAQTLLPVLLLEGGGPWRHAWVERAAQVTVRRLEEDVDRALLLHETDPEGFAHSGGLPGVAAGPPLDTEPGEPERQLRAHPTPLEETRRLFVAAPRDVTRLARALVFTVRRRLEVTLGRPVSTGAAFGAILEHALEAWGHPHTKVPREHRVIARDGFRCAVPGCSSYRNLHAHHVTYRSAGGSDDASNRITLCAFHHLRGVHAGRVRVTGRAPDRLRFDLGLRSGARPLVSYASGDVLLGEAKMG